MENQKRGRTQSKLPTDLIEDVLLRLQVKPVLRFKGVSRAWREMITSPTFIKLHCERSNSNNNSRIHILCSAEYTPVAKLYTLNLNSDDTQQRERDNDNDSKFRTERLRVNLQGSLHKELVGSCNGIVCLRNVSGWGFTLLNPSTRTHVKLPNIVTHKYCGGVQNDNVCELRTAFGFGYDGVDDDYKVVKIEQTSRGNREQGDGLYATSATVYSWRKNQWNTMQDKFYDLNYDYRNGVSCNNAIHWLAFKNYLVNPRFYVVAFNLHTGEFDRDLISLPVNNIGGRLALLKGCLHFVVINSNRIYNTSPTPSFDTEVDLWIIKDYSTRSWCRLAKIVVPLNYVRLITYSNKLTEILFYATTTGLSSNSWVFFKADLPSGREKARHSITSPFVPLPMLQPYVESLVTLESRPPLKAKDDGVRETRQEIQRCRAREKHLEAEVYRLQQFIKSTKKDEATEQNEELSTVKC